MPLANLVQDGVGDQSYEVGRNFDGIKFAQVALDLPAVILRAYSELILSSKSSGRVDVGHNPALNGGAIVSEGSYPAGQSAACNAIWRVRQA